MGLNIKTITLIFGLISSFILFLVTILFSDLYGVIWCFVSLGISFILYAVFAFIIPNVKNSRDFVFSYAVCTGCMFVGTMMAFVVISHNITRPKCNYSSNKCAKFIFGSIFGFLSSIFYLITSILSFKVANVW